MTKLLENCMLEAQISMKMMNVLLEYAETLISTTAIVAAPSKRRREELHSAVFHVSHKVEHGLVIFKVDWHLVAHGLVIFVELLHAHQLVSNLHARNLRLRLFVELGHPDDPTARVEVNTIAVLALAHVDRHVVVNVVSHGPLADRKSLGVVGVVCGRKAASSAADAPMIQQTMRNGSSFEEDEIALSLLVRSP